MLDLPKVKGASPQSNTTFQLCYVGLQLLPISLLLTQTKATKYSRPTVEERTVVDKHGCHVYHLKILNSLMPPEWLTPWILQAWCINVFQSQLSTDYTPTMWFAGSEAARSSPPDAVGSSWTHSSVTSGLSITQVRLCRLLINLCISLVCIVSHLRKCVFRILKIPWETPCFWALVPPHCQEKVFFLQINFHHLRKYLAVRQTTFYPPRMALQYTIPY